MKIEMIPTPALILDVDAAERNHRIIMELMKPLGVSLWPHYKSHKSTRIAHMQMAGGASGITCAKLGEAEDLILSGIPRVTIGNQVVDPAKIRRAADLAGAAELTLLVDDESNIRALNDACLAAGTVIRCLVELDIGMDRCGVRTAEEVFHLASLIRDSEKLEFAGIQAYAGNLAHEMDYEKRKQESLLAEQKILAAVRFLEDRGIPVKEVAGISTGTVELRPASTVYTQAQTGSYLLMDAEYDRVGVGFEHALYMLTQVVSRSDRHFVCDAGAKTLGSDQGPAVFPDFPDEVPALSEEHIAVYRENTLKTGDKLLLIPGHCCTTVNLHDYIYIVRKGEVLDRIPVTSRGKAW